MVVTGLRSPWAKGEAYMRKTTYIQAINEAMKEEMRRDDRE